MTAPPAAEIDREAEARRLLPRALRVAKVYAARLHRLDRLDDYESAAHLGIAVALDTFRPGNGTLKRWAERMVVLECFRVRRREVRRFDLGNEVEVELEMWGFVSYHDEARDEFERDFDVAAVLAKLAPRDRELIRLLYWQGLDAIRAGERLGICSQTVRKQRDRLLSQFRSRLS